MVSSVKIEGVTVGIDLRSDGVYLVIERPLGNRSRIDFGSVRALIESCGVEDWDFGSVLEALETKDLRSSRLISENTVLKRVDEACTVKISEDKMVAEIILTQPKNGGKKMTLEDIQYVMSNNRIKAGIDEAAMQKMDANRVYDAPYVVAKGREAANGENGYIEYFFRTEKGTGKPKELEDGKIDYFTLDLFQVAHKDQVLAKMHLPTPGMDGFKVTGEAIKAIPGKPALSPVGKNTKLDEVTNEIMATLDGQIVYLNRKINVNPVLEIRGNVDNSTGNVHFLGTVVIKANVLSGFTVTATGNIEIDGVVEGATLTSEADILIRGGVQGMGKAVLTAGGNISAKFIENATINAGNDVLADSIMRCSIKCSGSLSVFGKRGQIIGGKARVLHTITANTIGSQLEASTEIQVGLDPDLFEEYSRKRDELTKLKNDLTQINQIIDTLAKAREQGTLSEPKKAILVKSLQSKTHMKAKTTELFNDIEKLIPELSKGTGIVRAAKVINPGVKITIGNAILYVKETMSRCELMNIDGEIQIGAY